VSEGGPEKHTQDNDVLEIYKMFVEMADRVSQRRQSANSFYLTVNTGIIGGTAYLSRSDASYLDTFALSLAGIAICFLWVQGVRSYKLLNSAKFEVIHTLEERLPVSPFKDEWTYLTKDGDGKKHKPFNEIEKRVPIVLGIMHGTQLLLQVPWQSICSFLSP